MEAIATGGKKAIRSPTAHDPIPGLNGSCGRALRAGTCLLRCHGARHVPWPKGETGQRVNRRNGPSAWGQADDIRVVLCWTCLNQVMSTCIMRSVESFEVELWSKKTQAAIHHAHDRGTKRTTFAAASGFSVTSTPGTLAISRPFARFNMLSVLTLLPLEEPGWHEYGFRSVGPISGKGTPKIRRSAGKRRCH